jgi:membrane protein required for colicin V production
MKLTLHAVDYIIVLVVILSMLTGLFRGFLKELTALCVWGLAIWLGFRYSDAITPWLQPHIHDAMLRSVLGFLIILFAVILFGALLNMLISAMVHRSGLSGTDRLLGVLFGLVRGGFIVAFIIVVLEATAPNQAHYAYESIFYPQLKPLVHWLSGFVPRFTH